MRKIYLSKVLLVLSIFMFALTSSFGQSAKVVSTKNNRFEQEFANKEANKYLLSFWTKGTGSVKACLRDASGKYFNSNAYVPVTTDWSKMSIEFDANSGASNPAFLIYVANGSDVLIDYAELSIVGGAKIELVNAEFSDWEDDGSMPKSWTNKGGTTLVFSKSSENYSAGPVVLSGKFNIADNTEKIEADFIPTVSFTKAIRNIDDSEITNDNVKSLISFKTGDTDVDFSATINDDNTSVTITPANNLNFLTAYKATFAAVESADGTEATESLVLNFTTAKEVVLVAIKAVQETTDATGNSPLNGEKVMVKGKVTAVNANTSGQQGYYIQDANEAWSGIYVFDKVNTVAVGDVVKVKGTVEEYKSLSQIITISQFERLAETIDITPISVSLANVTEQYESMLITVEGNAKAASTNGSFTITDGTNELAVYKTFYSVPDVKEGYTYTITGPLSQYNALQILPLSAENVIAKSNEAVILTFAISNNEGDAVIDVAAKTITAKVKNGTNLTTLTAALTFSEKAIADKDLTQATDYTSPVDVKVTAENGVEVKWTIIITEAPLVSTENDITSFTITAIQGDAVINTNDHTVKATVVNGTALTNLVASIEVSEKATIVEDVATVVDYSAAVTFNVKAEDETVQPWIVTITEAAPAPKGGLFISEVADPKDKFDGRFVELYNAGDEINFDESDYYLVKLTNGDQAKVETVKLTGKLAANSVYVISNKVQADFEGFYPGVTTNLTSDKVINGNGNDPYILVKGADFATATIVDIYGANEDGTGKPWEYLDRVAVRNSNVINPNATWTASEWTIPAESNIADMTPGKHFVDGAEAPAFALTTSPANDAIAVAVDATVKVSFNRAITVPAEGLASLFTFKKGDVAVDFTPTIDEAKKVITLTPAANMEYVTVYTVTIAAVTSEDAALTDATSISFTTDAELTLSTIKQVQEVAEGGDASTLKGKAAWVKGVVTFIASNANGVKGYYIQDAATAWSGIYVYDNKHQDVTVGNLVSVIGMVDEYKNVTQIANLTSYQVVEASATLPEFITLGTNEIANEKYESILVKTTGVCSLAPDSYKNWKIKDASGVELSVDGYYYAQAAVVGNEYVISGFVNFFNNEFKISPRSASDIIAEKATAINDNNIKFSLYPNPTTGMFVVKTTGESAQYNVVVLNAIGQVVLTDIIANDSTKQFDLTNMGTGLYLVRISDSKGVKTHRVIVK